MDQPSVEEENPIYEVPIKEGVSLWVSAVGAKQPKWVLRSFEYEREIRERWFHVKEWDVVLDIGAGYGSYALWALALGASRVVAWEPNKEDLFCLLTSYHLNEFNGALDLINAIASETMGVTDNYYPDSHSFKPEGESEQRFMVPIDEWVFGKKLNRVNWIKIDAEGSELQVLNGAKKTLARFKPILIIECHTGIIPDVVDRVANILDPLGYACVERARLDHELIDTHHELWRHHE